MFCGFGWFPLIALSSGNQAHEHHYEESYKSRDGRAIDILKERYARGEITKDQFNEMRKEID